LLRSDFTRHVSAVAVGGGPTSTVAVTTSSQPTSSTTVPSNRVTVQVANGTNVPGLADTYTQQLQTANWNTLPELSTASGRSRRQ
jgi:hypothetical protein